MRLFQKRVVRKIKASQVKETRKMLVFQEQQKHYAITFDHLYRVIPFSSLEQTSDPQLASAAAFLDGRKVQLLDMDAILSTSEDPSTHTPNQFVIVFELDLDLFGLVIDTPPALRRLTVERFQPLRSEGMIQAVVEEEGITYFVLDPQSLIAVVV